MKITGVDPITGKQTIIESDKVDKSFIQAMSEFEMSDEAIKKMIDGLDASADIKALLYKIATVTIRAGNAILKIGRKIIDLICKICSEFPKATFGIVFGAILGVLVGNIAVIGGVLASIVGPILIAFGLVVGVANDLADQALERKIKQVNAEFEPLRG